MNTLILGGGFTGLAAGLTSGATVYEATDHPGGLGHDYEMNGCRFQHGGGHWLFGGDPSIIGFIQALTPCKRYERKASVYFPDEDKFYPYPIQQHHEFKPPVAVVYQEGMRISKGEVVTMKDVLRQQFGTMACARFFDPFNEAYTAGLYDKVAPQDAYKSPKTGSGYNVSFLYPREGLGTLARKMTAKCNVRFNKRARWVDVKERMVHFEDDTCQGYDRLISTLPLNRMMEMTGLNAGTPDPSVGVAVLNIGAEKGEYCPDSHWVYVPRSESGFHRVGFYSNVDPMFAPEGKVSIYVETSFSAGVKPSAWLSEYQERVVDELQKWGWIGEVEAVDPTFVPVAYSYRWPNSTWREDSLELLKKYDIVQAGRFGSWRFQGIMESIKEGFEAGCQT